MYKETVNDSVGHKVHSEKYVGGGWNVLLTETGSLRSNKRTQGVDTPSFYARKRRGELLPFTSFTQAENKTKSNSTQIHLTRVSDGYQRKWEGVIPSVSSDVVPFSTFTTLASGRYNPDVLLQSAGSRVNSAWDALTFVLEMDQTVRMFRNVVTKFTKLVNSKPPGTPTSLWLEGRYGWRNLLYDIEDIQEAIATKKRTTFRQGSAGSSTSWSTSSSGSFISIGHTGTWQDTTSYQLNARSIVIAKGEVPRFTVSPIKTAWEVTRLSFVLDWFIHVGRWIDAVQFVVSSNSYVAGVGFKIEATREWTENIMPISGWTKNSANIYANVTGEGVHRDPGTIPLVPLISQNLDRYKMVDLVALLVQALRRN